MFELGEAAGEKYECTRVCVCIYIPRSRLVVPSSDGNGEATADEKSPTRSVPPREEGFDFLVTMITTVYETKGTM